MNIIKKYWKWDESLGSMPFKLGQDIGVLVNDGLAYPNRDFPNTFKSKDGVPDLIDVTESKIARLYYRETFFQFPGLDKEFWKTPAENIIAKLDQMLTPCDEKESSDMLSLVFRDSYIAVAIISCSNS